MGDRHRLGRQVTLTVPTGAIVALIVLGLLLIAWYIFEPAQRNVAVFVTSIGAAFGLAINALNGIATRNMQLDSEERRERIEEQRLRQQAKDEALLLIKSWNDPAMHAIKNAGWDAVGKIKDVPIDKLDEVQRTDPGTESALIELLNYFEMVALAVLEDMADRELLKRYFRGLVVRVWTVCNSLIEKRRRDRGNPRLFSDVEKLYNQWR